MYTMEMSDGADSIVAHRQVWPHTNCYFVPGPSFEGGIFKEEHTGFCIAPLFAQFGAQSMDGLFEQVCAVVHIAMCSIGYRGSKSSEKQALGPTISWPGDKFCPTPTATSCQG